MNASIPPESRATHQSPKAIRPITPAAQSNTWGLRMRLRHSIVFCVAGVMPNTSALEHLVLTRVRRGLARVTWRLGAFLMPATRGGRRFEGVSGIGGPQ